ncbi:MAG TPA: crossover junction endodeoxyribonuclease RuvC, partial [Burkholderiaceae bacterium]|nr:crossover junction endodeoxyribonuclease RuvC [Burkholderiaceae bacterium]
MRILGIDPGLNRTGYGLIDVTAGRARHVAAGVVRVPAGDLPQRLAFILEALTSIIHEHTPQLAAIEQVFVNVNPKATLLLGQARGAAICAAVGAGLVVHEYSALQIKQAVVGYGKAAKVQVQAMVMQLLSLPVKPIADAADALACALAHAHAAPMRARVRALSQGASARA